MATAKKETADITIQPLRRGSVKLRIVGTQPMFQNRMSAKVKQGLLVGTKKKTRAERVEIKHHPLQEFRDSAEIMDDGPTALGLQVVAVKAAMATAALETPGMTKTSAQRLLFLPGDRVALYGTPHLRMDVVRSADMARTPDVRSRCFLPKWGAELNVQFIMPQLSMTSVVTLLCNAGVLVGVGDFRQEKGKGGYGLFRVIGEGEDDDEWNELVEYHARDAQEAALADPDFAGSDTAELMEFYAAETKRRAA